MITGVERAIDGCIVVLGTYLPILAVMLILALLYLSKEEKKEEPE